MSDQLVSPSIPIENKGDVAMRLLRGQQHPELSGATVVQLDEMVDLAECTHVPHLVDTRSMSLSERLRPWTRWTAPNLKARLDPLPHQTPISNKVQLPAVDWQPESKSLHTRRFHASFGHILHSAPRSPALKASGVDRILAPKVPHPAAFNKMMSEDDIARSAFILLKFTPTRKKTLRAIESPVVHLKLPVNPDSDFSNFTMPEDASLYAERSGVIHDVLLPENPVDVRLNIQDKLRFAIPEQPALLKFFEASEFNLAEGRLQTPASVEFSLPPNWPKNGSKGEWRLESYDFAGLEVHQTARLEWQAHMLRYSSIEAGQQGGRRQQLTLELDFVQDQDLADQRRSFLKAVDEIAMGRAFPWTDGHKLVVEEEIPEQVSEDIGSEAVVSVEADGQALLAHREQVEEVPGQGVPQPEGLAQEDTGVAAPAFKQLGEEVASALENLQQLTSSVEDAAHSYALASLTNDPGAIPGEELWASIATEECEAAIAEADELMDTVEDALTMFVGKEPSEVVIEEAKEDVNADEDQLPHIAIEASEVPFENGHELVFSANESPAFAAEGHNSTLGDQTRDDTNHATDILHQASTNIPPPDDMNISAQPAQAENVFKPQKDEVPRQAANDTTDPVASKNPASASPVDNQAEVDESSPWGHAQSLFR